MRDEGEDYGEQMRHMIYYRRAQRQSEGIVVLSGCLAQAMSNPLFWAALSLCCQRRRATYKIWRRLEGHVQIIFEMLWCIMLKKKQQPLGSRRSLYTIKTDPAPCSQCFPSPACCPNRNSFPAVPALFLN